MWSTSIITAQRLKFKNLYWN